MRKEPDPPKPGIQAPPKEGETLLLPEEGEAGRALALSGLDRMLEDTLGGIARDLTKPESALQEWHQVRILKKMGFPTLLRFSFTLPGDLVSHTMNAKPAGRVIEYREVVFGIDEAFLRQHGMVGPWVFRVESVVTPEMERSVREPKPATSEGSKPADTAPKGPTYRRFRIRQLTNYTVGLYLGFVSVTYELQELESDGTPGRRCKVNFLGAGSVTGASFMPEWLWASYGASSVGDWTEFELNPGKPAMRLEDFDGVKGYHSDAGAFVYSWSGAIFGTRDAANDQVARVSSHGVQIGIYAGGDSVKGHWRITQPPK
jgi:hypothetical protein